MAPIRPPVVLFGYDTSAFTTKVRLCLRLKQIPYTFVPVSSMMPRPQLRDSFNLTYRKIPVMALGREVYCDTSLIIEALEHFFPESEGFQSLYPSAADGRSYRPMIRGFASYWIDRPLFRVTCGLMPASIWRSAFGQDRAGLIGHKLDPDKLEKKIPENLSRLDQQLSMLEPLFQGIRDDRPWIFSTPTPSLADIALYYKLQWAYEIAAGRMTEDITQGETSDAPLEGMDPVFNSQRYPGLCAWYATIESYLDGLPSTEEKAGELDDVLEQLKQSPSVGPKSLLLPTLNTTLSDLDAKIGLTEGTQVSVAPDDTGRDDPTIGSLEALSPEEIVIKPQKLDPPAKVDVRVHFPKVGFVVRTVNKPKL